MKNKDFCSYIAVFFLVFIFIIPIMTLVVGNGKSDVINAQAEAVLAGNGTAADKIENTGAEGTQEINSGESDDARETDAAEKKVSFAALQDAWNGFTEKLFLKSHFIEGNTNLTSVLTGGTYMESTQVLLGKENWLFYKTQNDGYPIYDYMGINHFTEEEMAAMANNLILARDYFEKEMGIAFVAATIPNKEIIYEEYMPETIARVNEVSRGRQFAEYVWTHTDVPYVYPLEAFLEAKESYPLYYQTDTHWNHIGAFVGTQEILGKINGEVILPDAVAFTKTQTDFAGDLAVIAGVSDKYNIDTVYEFDVASVDPTHKKEENVIVVGDSFGGFLSVITDEYYENVYWIDTDDFTVSMAEEYDADIIIWETVERLQETFMQESLLD